VHGRSVQFDRNPNLKGGHVAARIQSVAAGSSDDPAINSLIDFAKNGFGDTQMFGLIALRLELLKRVASMFAYFSQARAA
jgi:hypothetical protein